MYYDGMTERDKTVTGERSLAEGILYYLSIVLRYKILVISLTVSAAALAVAFSILSLRLPPEKSPLPNMYRAYAIVVFPGGAGGPEGMASMLSAFGVDAQSGSGYGQAQFALQLLRSRAFLDAVVEKFDIINRFRIERSQRTYSRRFILNSTEYLYNRETGTLTVAFTHIDPIFAAEVVNYMVDLLEEWIRREGVTERSTKLARMREKLEELSGEISGIEKDIETFQREYGVMDVAEITAVQSAMLNDLRTRLNQVELEISDYTRLSTFEDPALTALRNRRNNILSQIERIESGYISSEGRKMPARAELPRLSLDMAQKQADLALRKQLYQTLSELYEVTRLTADEVGMLSILEHAEVPELKEGPARSKLIMLVTLATFAGSIACALVLNTLNNLKKPSGERA